MPEQSAAIESGSGPSGTYVKRGRFWAVTDAAGQLVCLAVYKKGAQEVLRRLAAPAAEKKPPTKPRRKQRGE